VYLCGGRGFSGGLVGYIRVVIVVGGGMLSPACLHFLWWLRNCGECEECCLLFPYLQLGREGVWGSWKRTSDYLTVKPLLQVACTFRSCEVVPAYTKDLVCVD
jgi:hypothetical protein